MSYEDYRYSDEARARDLQIIWKCNKCGKEDERPAGWNEGGNCYCGGEWEESGESYLCKPRW